MLNIPTNTRIYLCTQPTDMRKSFDGLHALAVEVLCKDTDSHPLDLRPTGWGGSEGSVCVRRSARLVRDELAAADPVSDRRVVRLESLTYGDPAAAGPVQLNSQRDSGVETGGCV